MNESFDGRRGTERSAGMDRIVSNEVIGAMFSALANEMWGAVTRSAYSPLWKDAGDMACGVLNGQCELIAGGEGNTPTQLGTLPMSAREAVASLGLDKLASGDLIAANDPYAGGNHLPDVLFLMPVVWSGSTVGFTAIRGHLPDIGGASPGSMAGSTNVFAEGLRIPAIRLVRKGDKVDDLWNVVLANVRHPALIEGDLQAAWGACQLGVRRFEDVIRRYGAPRINDAMDWMLDTAERRIRMSLTTVEDGTYSFADYLDDDGLHQDPVKIAVTIRIEGDRISVDFEGTDSVVPGNVNAPYAVACSSVYYALKGVLEPNEPANSGTYRPIDVRVPESCFVNAVHPAAVANGNTETAARISDVVLGALSQAAPERVPAAGAGTSMVLFVNGEQGDDTYTLVEVHGGAQGASLEKDGLSAIRVGPGNTGNTSSEVIERSYPLRVERYSLEEGSAGAGRRRGGFGIHRRLRLLAPAQVITSGDRARRPPYGLDSGAPGGLARVSWSTGEDVHVAGSAKTGPTVLSRGSIVDVRAPGGGGYGPPEDRETELVLRDLEDGLVSVGTAREVYGIEVEKVSTVPGRRFRFVGRSTNGDSTGDGRERTETDEE